jgi:hypothetical protein
MGKGASSGKVVLEIQRRTRQRFSAEEKIGSSWEDCGEKASRSFVAAEGLAPNLYYRWSKKSLEADRSG